MNTITSIDQGRRLPPMPMPFARVLRAYLIEAKHEFRRLLRMPAFAIPFLVLPIFLYLLIGVLVVGQSTNADARAPLFIFTGFVVFAATGSGMFGFGQGLAVERQAGVLTLKRAQPMPAVAYVTAKMLTALICTAIDLSIMIPLAIGLAHVSMTMTQITGIVVASMLGTVSFCAIGFFIGSFVSGSAAPAVVNLLYFPMMYLSGMFFPLPKMLAPWAMIWPTFYLDQLVYSVGGGQSAMSPGICAAMLVGMTVLCGGLATRRLARVG
jgi:ABC-2 type transport system permease protein